MSQETNPNQLKQAIDALPDIQTDVQFDDRISQALDRADAEQLIHRFYQALIFGGMEQLPFSEDFSYKTPISAMQGREAFLKACSSLNGSVLRIEVEGVIHDTDQLCVRYRLFPAGGEEALAGSDWFQMKDQHIEAVESFFDASRYFNQMTG